MNDFITCSTFYIDLLLCSGNSQHWHCL